MERITVIIPTLATAERGPYLAKAIDSVLTQAGVKAIPIVVVNGDQTDSGLLRWLEKNRKVRLRRIETHGMPNALQSGWESVDTRFFGELDDDDELFPQALSKRRRAFGYPPEVDVVVTRGIVRGNHGDEYSIPDLDRTVADPLRALLESNWLLPGSALFRKDRMNDSVFANIPAFLEWTYIALRLSMDNTLRFLSDKTFLHHTNLPFSMNASYAGMKGRAYAMRTLLDLDLPVDVRRTLERKAANAHHCVAQQEHANGQTKEAWSWHLKSLIGRGGWRYLAYTRKLLLPR